MLQLCACFQSDDECLRNDPFNEFKKATDRKTFTAMKEMLTLEENTSNDDEASNFDDETPTGEEDCKWAEVLLLI